MSDAIKDLGPLDIREGNSVAYVTRRGDGADLAAFYRHRDRDPDAGDMARLFVSAIDPYARGGAEGIATGSAPIDPVNLDVHATPSPAT